MADRPANEGHSSRATVIIALVGIAATLIAAIGSSALTGHQQTVLQDKNLAAQTEATDRAELRGVIDEAERALLKAQGSFSKYQAVAEGNTPNSARFRRERLVATNDAVSMQLPEARLTVRLGAAHEITDAYRLASQALIARLGCFVRQPRAWNVDKADAVVDNAVEAFNTRATALAGSAILPRPHPQASSAPQLGPILDAVLKALDCVY
jgi:hypothetical protein